MHDVTSDKLDVMLSPADREQLHAALKEAHRTLEARKLTMRLRRSSPTKGYAPGSAPCPPRSNAPNYAGLLRNASDQQLSPQEADFMNRHRNHTRPIWKDWLTRAGLDGSGGLPGGVDSFLEQAQPKVGFAIAGGGYRSMQVGLGQLQGFDNRNKTAMDRGVGGLLQAADYVAGLSGGSWGTGVLAINNWPTTQDLAFSILELTENLVKPKDGTLSFYLDLYNDVGDKKEAKYPTSITDYWGRALSYHLLNNTVYPEEGQAITFSDIQNVSTFADATYPFPIALTIGRMENELMINSNATYYEISPYEFGSWQPGVRAFWPTEFMGTSVQNGEPTTPDCIAGYDNFGFVVGASSTLFNSALLILLQNNGTGIVDDALKTILEDITKSNNDVAAVPNPLQGYSPGTNPFSHEQMLDLVDGGEANQNLPLEPLIQPARGLDMIISLDGSGDTINWPNGTALWETQKRMNESMFSDVGFPRVPDQNTFVNLGLNTRPTFFGCNATDVINADTAAATPPLIVYLPNYPYSYLSNTSTFQLAYSKQETQGVIDSNFEAATMGGRMPDWHECLACAATMRGMQRQRMQIPSKCQACMTKYCWDGTTNDNKAPDYTPPIGPPPFVTSNGTKNVEPPSTGTNQTSGGGIVKIISGGANGAVALTALPTAVLALLVAAAMLFI